MEVLTIFVLLVALIIAIAMMLAQFRLFSIDKTLRQILAQLQAPPRPESEAELAQRRAAIAEVRDNWLIK